MKFYFISNDYGCGNDNIVWVNEESYLRYYKDNYGHHLLFTIETDNSEENYEYFDNLQFSLKVYLYKHYVPAFEPRNFLCVDEYVIQAFRDIFTKLQNKELPLLNRNAPMVELI